MMIEVDGSMFEGGGSIVRIAVGLSALRGVPVRVFNIRAKRENPGLREQHLEGIRAVCQLCSGKLTGDELGSMEIEFYPGREWCNNIEVRIRTAGNITLVLQSVMLAALGSKNPVKVRFEGGATDAPLAPPIDYFRNITIPTLRRMGYRCEIVCQRRGHYPKGGARVEVLLYPSSLGPLLLSERGRVVEVRGISHCVKLPNSVAHRQAQAATDVLKRRGYEAKIDVETSPDGHLGPGSGIVLWAICENGLIGSTSLGRPGKPAERVGEEAANDLITQLETGMSVDRYLTDQLIPYMALADGVSEITSCEITMHALTNIYLVEKFLDVKFELEGKLGSPGRIRVKGVGFSPQ